MINILLDTLDFSVDFLYEQLKHSIHPEDHIKWINYYTDSKSKAAELIRGADILYLPDRMMERIDEFNLRSTLLQFQGVVLGYSAGDSFN